MSNYIDSYVIRQDLFCDCFATDTPTKEKNEKGETTMKTYQMWELSSYSVLWE